MENENSIREYKGIEIFWNDLRQGWDVEGRFFYTLDAAERFVREEIVWDCRRDG